MTKEWQWISPRPSVKIHINRMYGHKDMYMYMYAPEMYSES